MHFFKAKIQIIGVNPYVLLPAAILKEIFKAAGREKGSMPVQGTIDGHRFIQTLVKYSGKWRLYLNTPMRKAAKKEVGDWIEVAIEIDRNERIIPIHPKLSAALKKNQKAKIVFDQLSPSRRKEIVRYIANLKSAEAVERNVEKAISFLQGKTRFVGRDNP